MSEVKFSVYTLFIIFLILSKIIYTICMFWMLYLREEKKENDPIYEKLRYWRERSEAVFMIGVSFIIIQAFNPFTQKLIQFSYVEKGLVYTLGWVVLLTVNWDVFIGGTQLLNIIKFFKE